MRRQLLRRRDVVQGKAAENLRVGRPKVRETLLEEGDETLQSDVPRQHEVQIRKGQAGAKLRLGGRVPEHPLRDDGLQGPPRVRRVRGGVRLPGGASYNAPDGLRRQRDVAPKRRGEQGLQGRPRGIRRRLDADIPWRRVAATPRPCDVDTPWRRVAPAATRLRTRRASAGGWVAERSELRCEKGSGQGEAKKNCLDSCGECESVTYQDVGGNFKFDSCSDECSANDCKMPCVTSAEDNQALFDFASAVIDDGKDVWLGYQAPADVDSADPSKYSWAPDCPSTSFGRADISPTSRGDAAATTWIFLRRFAATPRTPR